MFQLWKNLIGRNCVTKQFLIRNFYYFLSRYKLLVVIFNRRDLLFGQRLSCSQLTSPSFQFFTFRTEIPQISSRVEHHQPIYTWQTEHFQIRERGKSKRRGSSKHLPSRCRDTNSPVHTVHKVFSRVLSRDDPRHRWNTILANARSFSFINGH